MADTRRRRKRGREGEDRQEEKLGKESVKDLPFPSSKLLQFVHGGVDLVHRNWCLQPECSNPGTGEHWKRNPQASPSSSSNLECKAGILKNISLGAQY